MAKFERTKPHISVGTIAHYRTGNARSHARMLMQLAALNAVVAAQDTSSVTLYGNESTGPKTYTNMNQGPMQDYRTRDERRGKKKRKHGPKSGSRYKKGRWWE
jgi:hypothetical protein